MKPKVSVIRCLDYNTQQVDCAVREALRLVGGLSRFVVPGSRVLVKPNLLMPLPPERGITTHPEVLRAVIRCLKEINCVVTLGDGPSVWGNCANDIHDLYEKTGMKKLADSEGVRLVVFDKRRWRKSFPLAAHLDECDCFVSVPKFKTHSLTVLTAAVKNLYGLVPGSFKTEIHKNNSEISQFCAVLLDIYQEAKPALTVVDGIVAMEGNGPATGGSLKKAGIIVAGQDCVAIDSVLAEIMGLKPLDIPTNKVAFERKIGETDILAIDITGVSLNSLKGLPFKLPGSSWTKYIPQPLLKVLTSFLKVLPSVEQKSCKMCLACVDACPQKTISSVKGSIRIEYSKCISCFCCAEACPASAIKIKKSFLVKLARL